LVLSCLAAALVAGGARAEEKSGLKKGDPALKSVGPMAFGPTGVLFVGDPKAAAVFAIDTGDKTAAEETGRPKVTGLDEKIAALLGVDAKDVLVNDVVVNPISGNVYLSVSRGKGPNAAPAILRLDRASKLTEFALKGVPYARAELTKAPTNEKQRTESITKLAYADGKLYIAGLSSEEFASTLRSLPFPFTEADQPTSVEIFHGAHGRLETRSPVRTFLPLDVDGEACLLATYTCTPLVKIPVKALKPNTKVKGTTVAELGNHNQPLDMIVYQKNGKEYILLANSARGVMKIPTAGLSNAAAINDPVKTETAGMPYETIAGLKNVVQLDRFDKDHAVVLIKTASKGLDLETIELP
jgi:hypothetical protein